MKWHFIKFKILNLGYTTQSLCYQYQHLTITSDLVFLEKEVALFWVDKLFKKYFPKHVGNGSVLCTGTSKQNN